MAINQLGFEQSATLIAALHAQVTGMTSIAPTDTASFISMAQATLRAGYEPVLNAIGQVLGRTLIAVRPYSRKFKGLEMSRERWGGITRKINFGEKALDPYDPLNTESGDPTFALVDGYSIDQYVVKKPEVLQTVYVGQNVYESSYTIFTKQLDTAFSSPSEFGAFMSGLMEHFSNEREQYLESLSRAILCNMIGAKKVLDAAGVDLQIIDLLAEYNTATGLSLTATSVREPDNYPAFAKWAYAYIQHVSEMFTERTEMFQRPLTSYHIMRHTPKADQRLFMDADFLAHMTAEVLADTYHDNFLRYSEVEAVNFWQAAKDPNEVNVTPVYLNANCEYVNATDPVLVEGIVGVLMDRDAAGYNLADDDLVASPYNAKGQYYNLYNHVRIQLQNDLTEKAVVFCIGEGGGGGGGGGSFNEWNVSVTVDGEGTVGLYATTDEANNYTCTFNFEDAFNNQMETTQNTVVKLITEEDSAEVDTYGTFVSAEGAAVYDAETHHLTISGDCSIVMVPGSD